MQVTIVGAGNMGRGIATRLAAGGHAVTFVDTDTAKAEAVAAELRTGEPNAKVAVAGLADGLPTTSSCWRCRMPRPANSLSRTRRSSPARRSSTFPTR